MVYLGAAKRRIRGVNMNDTEDYLTVARSRSVDSLPDHQSRCCVSDLDLMLELMVDIPQGGRLVKTGANCPMTLTIAGARPDIKIISIGDGDLIMDHEVNIYRDFPKLRQDNYDCRPMADALAEAAACTFEVSMLFFDAHFKTDGLEARLKAWIPHLPHPGWVVLHDWVRYKTVQEAAKAVLKRWPDKWSGCAGAWKHD